MIAWNENEKNMQFTQEEILKKNITLRDARREIYQTFPGLNLLFSKEYDGKAIIGKVDVDSNPETAMKYGIRNIPTILFIKGGQVVDKQVGAVPKANLVAMLNKHLS